MEPLAAIDPHLAEYGLAIVGLGGCMPDAPDIATFWRNIQAGHVAIGDVPPERWSPDVFWSPDRSMMDRTYSRIGAFIRYENFDRRKFRMVPKSLPSVDAVQKWSLTAVAEALADAKLEVFAGDGSGRPFDRERCAVILGNAMGGESEDRTSLRVWLLEMRQTLLASAGEQGMSQEATEALVNNFFARAAANLPTITEDSMVGELSNCISGRIANVFNLCGPNFTTDAACASSMAALSAAAEGLLSRAFDMALVGGADRSMDPPTYVKFSRIGALSAHGSMPFDERASGFVMGEGAGILVIKRLADALRDGDRVLAVVRGIGASSDGAGKGMTAPNPRGQRLAIERAWAAAQAPLSSAGLIEAHGTSTPVGDLLELTVLNELLTNTDRAAPVPIGSVKSMIGHLKSAAGAASLIKATLALHHGILPASAGYKGHHESSPLNSGRLMVNHTTRAWPHESGPRRAGVSSFGFGGINFHVVLEALNQHRSSSKQLVHSTAVPKIVSESVPVAAQPPASVQAPSITMMAQEVVALFAERTGYSPEELELEHHLEADLGIDTVKQAEVLAVLRQRHGLAAAASLRLSELPTLRAIAEALVAQMNASESVVAPKVEAQQSAPTAVPAALIQQAASTDTSELQVVAVGGDSIADAVARGRALLSSAQAWPAALPQARAEAARCQVRVAFAASSAAQAQSLLNSIIGKKPALLAPRGIFVAQGAPLADASGLCFLFPGQGSQYCGMLEDLAKQYPVVADTFAEADRVLQPLLGHALTEVIWPAKRGEEAEDKLKHTDMCQPSMLTADVALLRLLAQFGVAPARVAGHSLGEYAAAVAAGVLSFNDALLAVSARGREMANVEVADPGKMAVVTATGATVESALAAMDVGYVIAANKNCHSQTVIAGGSDAIDRAILAFAAQGIEARTIPVSHAFHSEIVAPATQPLRRVLMRLNVQSPKLPLCANASADYFPQDTQQIVDLMAKQLASPVEFIGQVQRLYGDGARLFVEVGPKRALTGFVRNILGDSPHLAIATNHGRKPSAETLYEALAALAAHGILLSQSTAKSGEPGVKVLPAVVQPLKGHVAHPAVAVSGFEGVPAAEDRGVHQRAQPAEVGALGRLNDPLVISGLSAFLPTTAPISAIGSDPLAALISGQNFIELLSKHDRQRIVDKRVARLDKGSGQFIPIKDHDGVLKLASKLGNVDLDAYGVDPSLQAALDITGRLALAGGLDALRDAGLPLVRHMRTTSTGSQLFDRWGLPAGIAERTGVVLASAFPGFDAVMEAAQHAHSAGDEIFDRKWLFRALPLGHAQFAQFILAQGPNTQINAACASGSQAVGIASDWIRLGRCDRVVVISADDVTRPESLPWFASGFLAVGSASIEGDIARAAVPFGSGRNGLVLGAGATAMVLERQSEVAARGLVPIAELVSAQFGNSAFHGTRLDSAFIKQFFSMVTQEMATALHTDVKQLAKRLVFMSHETYTPARGGSSAAEVDGLRHAFGAAVGSVLVANTKGYTGHAMGASLEDACVLRGLQLQQLPGIANLTAVDPAFKDLNFARGGTHSADVALRFAAGFGSQVAATGYRRRATGLARLVNPQAFAAWCARFATQGDVQLAVVNRTLRLVAAGKRSVTELGILSLQIPANPMAADAKLQDTAKSSVGHAPAAYHHEQANLTRTTVGATGPKKGVSSSKEEILAELTRIFAQETGYGDDELSPTYALEADLGIDTVKQAEIFARVRKHYGLAQEQGFALASVSTLEAWADYVAERSCKTSAADPAAKNTADSCSKHSSSWTEKEPAAVSQPPAVAPTASEQAILAQLVALFAHETGYAEDELDPGHALEADLGIDTVKQAELVAQVRHRFALPATLELKLSDMPTLSAMAQVLSRLVAGIQDKTKSTGEAAATAIAAKQKVAADQDKSAGPHLLTLADPGHLAREGFDVRRVGLAPCDPAYDLTPQVPSGALWIAGSVSEPVFAALAKQARAAGMTPYQVPADTTLVAQVAAQGMPEGIVILLDAVKSSARTEMSALYGQLHGLATCGTAPMPHLLVVGQNCGGFGLLSAARGSHSEALVQRTELICGAAGLLKTLSKEWPQSRCLTLDVCHGLAATQVPPAALAEAVLGHWGKTGIHAPQELVALLDQEKRSQKITWFTPTRIGGPAQVAPRPLAKGAKVVVTGGARGVTFALVEALAHAGPLDLFLLARTNPLDPQDSPLVGCDDTRARVLAQEALRAEGQRITPAAIRAWIARIHERVNIWHNIARLRELGSSVHFIACDVSAVHALRTVAAEITQDKEPCALLLHGAGSESSRLLQDKKAADFDHLAAIKLDALAELNTWLKPARIVTMGSVAGRYGNGGQSDYGAANEMLAAQARSLPQMLNLAWTAWDDLGMATRGSIKQVLEDLGVRLIPARIAVALGAAAIASDLVGDVVVAGELGVMAAHEHLPPQPFCGLAVLHDDQGKPRQSALRLSACLDPQAVLALAHHRIDGVAVLPGVIGLEMMVQAANLVRAKPVKQLVDVTFDLPVKCFFDRPLMLDVEAEPLLNGGPGDVRMRLFSLFRTPAGQVRRREHFSAVAKGKAAARPKAEPPVVPATGRHFQASLDREAIYQRYFHGPAFQVLSDHPTVVSYAASAEGLRPQTPWFAPQTDANFASWPWAREAGFQAAGLWEMAQHRRMALPHRIDAVWLADGESTRVRALTAAKAWLAVTPTQSDDKGTTFNVVMGTLAEDGTRHTVDIMQGYRCIVTGALSESQFFTPQMPQALAHGADAPVTDSVELAAIVPWLAATAAEQVAAILHPREQEVFAKLQKKPRRLTWLAGRLVAKSLVQASWPHKSASPHLKDIIIIANDEGAPEVQWARPSTNLLPPPHLSISHAAGRAVAVVTWDAKQAVGIDIEEIRAREPSFVSQYFTAAEQAAVSTHESPFTLVTVFWAGKEAVLKALGVGARLDFRLIELELKSDKKSLSVVLKGEAQRLAQKRGLSFLQGEVIFNHKQDIKFVCAWTLFGHSSQTQGRRRLTSKEVAGGSTTQV